MVQISSLAEGFQVSEAGQRPVRGAVPYHRPMSLWWWLENRVYLKFVIREFTSVFVGGFAVLLLWQVRAMSEGSEAYAVFVDRLATPSFILLSAIALLFVLYHTITWLNLVHTIVVIRLGGRRVPDEMITVAHYVLWVALSMAVTGILLLK